MEISSYVTSVSSYCGGPSSTLTKIFLNYNIKHKHLCAVSKISSAACKYIMQMVFCFPTQFVSHSRSAVKGISLCR